MEVLLHHNAVEIEALTNECFTALSLAVAGGFVAGVETLIKHHAQTNYHQDKMSSFGVDDREDKERNLVAQPSLTRLQHHGVEIEAVTNECFTALSLVATDGHVAGVETLTKHRAQTNYHQDEMSSFGVDDCEDNKRNLVAQLSSTRPTNDEIMLEVRALFEHLQLVHQWRFAVVDGCTALHLATEQGHAGATTTLVKHRAQIERRTKNGDTTLRGSGSQHTRNIAATW
ncbi:ankyrin repeat protein, putative [Bodo saltans]|uniref:Ankyrin repeat protein, putative n=1 Tax=Bodo saltans TaxID=75058 RepID=A0A0S4IWE7_BODSA|nr:ankyrin repeat protein, putative [Bodo saltans]|eukprot:CUG05313.1 ankyrin repeat protein, putative [Bodo saltans]